MKIFSILFILFFSTSVFAKWVLLQTNSEGYDFYYENKLIYKDDKYIYFWQLNNYPKRDADGDMSAVFYSKLNCETLKYKWLYLKFYDGPMGNGNLNAGFSSDEWQDNPSNSVGALIDEYICNNYY